MKTRTIVSMIGLTAAGTLALVLLLASSGTTGLYHSSGTLFCYDCHTMHFSMQHNWDGSTPVPTTPNGSGTTFSGNWLSASGPNQYLLKAPANQLCLSCHDGQTFAPDVFETNTNAGSYTAGREAGALRDLTGAAPYYTWTGHTLGSTATPPGYNPAVVGASATWYTGPTNGVGLACTDCHAQHGSASAYRNLGSYSLGGARTSAAPTFVVNTTNTTTVDVWVNQPSSYVAGSGSPSTFGPYYDTANIFFNRNDKTVGTNKSSNAIGVFCATCHGNFHGGPGDSNIGASAGTLEAFIRHPNAQVTIGAAGTQGYGGHSSLSQYTAATTKVKVTTTQYTTFSDAAPACITCHKAHGNQNPFGLIFLNRQSVLPITEEGGWATGEAQNVGQGLRNLCGQCHSQGN